MKKYFVFIFIIVANLSLVFSQPGIEWQKSFGGSESDYSRSINPTTDGGYIITGYTESNDSDVTNYRGGGDYWVVKINSSGAMEWQKTYGGTSKDVPNSIKQTKDGGYVIAGYSLSNDVDVSGNHGQEDYWIVKINSSGIIQWAKSLGGSNNERGYDIVETFNGGFIVAGLAKSIDGDVTGHHGNIAVQYDYWVVSLDSSGTKLWAKCFGGSSGEIAQTVIQTSDSCFIVAGQCNSLDGDVVGHHGTNINCDVWILKFNSAGSIIWQKSLGGTLDDFAHSIQETSDGGFIFTGTSTSSDGDVTLHWGSFVSYDVWVVKLDGSGNIQWQKTFGGTGTDESFSIKETNDNGFVFVGYTNSDDGDLTGLHGINFDYDQWIVKLNSTGTIEWQKLLGGTNDDIAYSVLQSSDDGFVISGYTNSKNRDVIVNYGKGDFWVVKLSSLVNVHEIQNEISDFNVFPNPISGETYFTINLTTGKNVSLLISDAKGRTIKNLKYENFHPGLNKIMWNGNNNEGREVGAGIYFATLFSGDVALTKKIVVID